MARTWPPSWWETASDRRSISCASNQPQYELLHHFFGSNANLFHLTSTVFKLPDELIISILSHVSPDPRLTGPYTWFCTPYSRNISDARNQWAEFLRPLTMTCREMRLRFLPWVWEHLVLRLYISEGASARRLNTVVNASHADKFLVNSVKYFHPFFPWVEADPCPLKAHDNISLADCVYPPSVRQMLGVPPKPPHVIDSMRGRLRYDPTRGGA